MKPQMILLLVICTATPILTQWGFIFVMPGEWPPLVALCMRCRNVAPWSERHQIVTD